MWQNSLNYSSNTSNNNWTRFTRATRSQQVNALTKLPKVVANEARYAVEHAWRLLLRELRRNLNLDFSVSWAVDFVMTSQLGYMYHLE